MEEEEEHLAAVAEGTCRAESESSPHHQEVREGIGGHYYWSFEELLFQELVTQLLLRSSIKQQQQLQGNTNSPPPPRLGSGELVQLRKLFQETTRTTRLFKLVDVQVQEVKDLEAEMRELKLQGTTTEGRGGEGGGGHTTTQTKAWNGSLMMMMRYSEDEEEEDTAVEDDVVVGGAKDLETKMMQLGDMELEQQHGDDTRLEEAAAAESQKQQQQHNSGKRRTCFGVAISKFDVKKSRLDHLPSFTKPKPILKEEETQ